MMRRNGKTNVCRDYCGSQKWNEKVPHHNVATIALSKFDRKDDTDPMWNHPVGEKNNNTEKEITYQGCEVD